MRTRKNASVRRQEIVDAAIEIIGARGYGGLTIQGLADHCAMTNAGVMHHFASKQDILLAVLDEREHRDEAALAALHPAGFPGSDHPEAHCRAVASLLRAMVGRNAGQPEIVRLFVALRCEAVVPEHPAHAHFRAREGAILAALQDLVQPLVDEPLSLARQVVALMQGLEEQWVTANFDFDLEREWDRAAARFLPCGSGD
jgi:AcrR family transcriptional regulator